MANLVLGFPNLIDGTTLTGGAWSNTMTVQNLKLRQLDEKARSVDATIASTQFVANFNKFRSFQLIALVNHNLSPGARWEIDVSNESDFTPLITTYAVDAWGAAAAAAWVLDELEWEANNFWYGTFSQEEIAGLTPISVMYWPASVSGQYLRVRIIDESNDDDYVELGRVFIGSAWSPRINYNFGDGFGYEDPTNVEQAMSGAEFFDVKNRYRVFRFVLGFLSKAEKFEQVLEMQRRLGISGEVLVLPDYADEDNFQRQNFLGRLRQLNPVETLAQIGSEGPVHSAAFEIKELL